MRILVVEDEQRIASYLKKGLELHAHTVDVVHDGEAGLDLALAEKYDVIVLDLMLPKLSGLEVCRSLRAENNHIPVLMLTAKTQVEERVTGLECGADDYLGKPFAFTELVARINALGRRPPTALHQVLICDSLTLNTVTYEVTRAKKRVPLSKKEFALLEYLLRHQGHVLSAEQLINHVWNYDSDALPNTAQVYIGYLRSKIDKPFPHEAPLIHTVHGFGYRLSAGT